MENIVDSSVSIRRMVIFADFQKLSKMMQNIASLSPTQRTLLFKYYCAFTQVYCQYLLCRKTK